MNEVFMTPDDKRRTRWFFVGLGALVVGIAFFASSTARADIGSTENLRSEPSYHPVIRKRKPVNPAIERATVRYRAPRIEPVGGGDTSLIRKARSYVGMSARQIGLHRYTLWCSAFMRYVAGSPRGVDDRAISWNSQPHISAQVGAIAIVRSVRIHVGVVSGFDKSNNPILISGNHRNRVAEAVYPRSSVIAYVAAPRAVMAMVQP